MDIQWYPGHMTKTRRMMEENQKLIDVVVELLDARIPLSSRNPAIDEIFPNKPRLVVLNKSDIADPRITAEWERYFASKGLGVRSISSTSGKSLGDIFNSCKERLEFLNVVIRLLLWIIISLASLSKGLCNSES